MRQNVLGSRAPLGARTRWGSFSAPPDPMAAMGVPTSKGKGKGRKEEEKERGEREGKDDLHPTPFLGPAIR